MEYNEFLKTKKVKHKNTGIKIYIGELNKKLKPFQKYIVKWVLEKGKSCIFSECGTGKTLMQLEWANQIVKRENKSVLILTPLAVNLQTIEEAKKFDVGKENNIKVEKYNFQKKPGIYVLNYEQLNNVSMSEFVGVVLDESGILKNFSGSYRNLIIESCKYVKYKLACTATPSPNDDLELGNHSEFIDNMTSMDMRAMFFTTDKSIKSGQKYRLKKYSIQDFYSWIASWAIVITKPSDLGFSDEGYELPSLNLIERKIETEIKKDTGLLFNETAVTATTFNQELRNTMDERVDEVLKIVNSKPDESFLIWVKHNKEADLLEKMIDGSRQISGSDKIENKEKNLMDFKHGKYKVLITKAKIAQFGLNFQNCHNQIFCSLDFSFESLYQAIRRSYRFGQKNQVDIYLITTDTMENVLSSIKEKQYKFNKLREGIMDNKDKYEIVDNSVKRRAIKNEYYEMIQNDCIAELDSWEDNSIDYYFFSPPFGSLYVFSDKKEDMSNVKSDDEFFEHFKYLVPKLLRTLKEGRLCSLHIMQSTTLKGRDGFYSIKDFRGEIIRLFQDCGFYFHAENMIRKDPKTAAIRTKNHQLMYGTTKKDSSVVRPGLADYILTFRKPGENKVPIINDIKFEDWCRIAEPVWIDINEGDTLTYRQARGEKDEKHITPTQLKTIENCLLMWSNKGDIVSSPFSGVSSEGHQAIKMGRKYKAVELKNEYFDQSIINLDACIKEIKEEALSLFDI